ncbi:hypothetical protein So717_28140 [Roseobacter cerasinus]|uniref:Uncharacterized protein n=2 Tax=Roseobacter cerasinus TaxID=2602289 RepID=A0A640VVE7_9RHOB|nr:hypothetical protein So717_28140 [Roseobacter cerasinus]
MIAARLGLSPEADATVVMLTLPDMLVNILLAGGFSAALVPALSRAAPAERLELLQRSILYVTSGAVVLGIGLLVFRNTLLDLLAPSLDTSALTNFHVGFALSILVLPLSFALGPSAAYLQVERRNALPPLSVVVFNGVLLVYFATLPTGLTHPGLMDFTLFGAAMMVAVLLRLGTLAVGMSAAFRKTALQARFPPGFGRQFLQGVAAQSLVAATPIIFRSLQSTSGPGNLAAFSFAERLFHLPVALLISPIMLIFLPILSRLSQGSNGTFRARILLASDAAFAATLSAAGVLALFAVPISEVVFGYGRMQIEETTQIASSFRIFLAGLPAFAIFQVMSAALNAQMRTLRVLQATILALATSVLVFLTLDQAGLPAYVSASWGFASFHIAAAAISVLFAMETYELPKLARQLGRTFLRCMAVLIPTVLILNVLSLPESLLTDLFLILCITVLMTVANFRVFLSLRSVRIDEGETSQ